MQRRQFVIVSGKQVLGTTGKKAQKGRAPLAQTGIMQILQGRGKLNGRHDGLVSSLVSKAGEAWRDNSFRFFHPAEQATRMVNANLPARFAWSVTSDPNVPKPWPFYSFPAGVASVAVILTLRRRSRAQTVNPAPATIAAPANDTGSM